MAWLYTFAANYPGYAMKWVLAALAGLLSIFLIVSVTGIVMDPARLDFWTQALMWCLLAIVLVVPAALFFATRSADTDATSKGRSEKRSIARSFAYVFSVVVVGWTAISMVSLFTDSEHLDFWTQSVLWSLLVLVVWAPVMTFIVNPFEDPALRTPLGPPNSVSRLEDKPPAFVEDEAASMISTPAPSTEPEPSPADLEDVSDKENRDWPYV